MRSSFWLTRGALPLLAALATAPVFALPANAQAGTAAPKMVLLSEAMPSSRTWGVPEAAATPDRTAEWWLDALNAQQSWSAAPERGAGVTVAVLSTGVDAGQQDLAGSVTTGPDYTGAGHAQGSSYWGYEGTAVASLIAGHGHGTSDAQGITGIAPRARILSVRVTLDYNDPDIGDAAVTRRLPDAIASGIRYAVSHGAKVIALPLDPATLAGGAGGAGAGGSAAEEAAVRYAVAHNVVLIAPAGDDGSAGDAAAGGATSAGAADYPAAYPGVVAIGATGSDGNLATFSSTGSYVALTAPGAGLTAALPSGYGTMSTTDLGAALTAGVAALIQSRYPGLTAAEVTQALEESATPANPKAPGTGNGELNALGAITAAASIFSLNGNPMPDPAPAWNSYLSTHGHGSRGNSSRLADGAAASGAFVVIALAIAFLLTRRRRRRAEAGAKAGIDGSSRRRRNPDGGRSPRRSGRSAWVKAWTDDATPEPPAPEASSWASDSAAARALAADALIGKNPGAAHPPWEVAERLSARRAGQQSGWRQTGWRQSGGEPEGQQPGGRPGDQQPGGQQPGGQRPGGQYPSGPASGVVPAARSGDSGLGPVQPVPAPGAEPLPMRPVHPSEVVPPQPTPGSGAVPALPTRSAGMFPRIPTRNASAVSRGPDVPGLPASAGLPASPDLPPSAGLPGSAGPGRQPPPELPQRRPRPSDHE